MIAFIKLTPEICFLMWSKVRIDSMIKHGKSIHYQVPMDTLKRWKGGKYAQEASQKEYEKAKVN